MITLEHAEPCFRCVRTQMVGKILRGTKRIDRVAWRNGRRVVRRAEVPLPARSASHPGCFPRKGDRSRTVTANRRGGRGAGPVPWGCSFCRGYGRRAAPAEAGGRSDRAPGLAGSTCKVRLGKVRRARAFTRHVTRVDTTADTPGDFRVMAYLSTPPPYALSYPTPASGSTRAAHPQLKLTASGVSSFRTALRMARRTERSI